LENTTPSWMAQASGTAKNPAAARATTAIA
jgi:hypothetical protein